MSYVTVSDYPGYHPGASVYGVGGIWDTFKDIGEGVKGGVEWGVQQYAVGKGLAQPGAGAAANGGGTVVVQGGGGGGIGQYLPYILLGGGALAIAFLMMRKK